MDTRVECVGFGGAHSGSQWGRADRSKAVLCTKCCPAPFGIRTQGIVLRRVSRRRVLGAGVTLPGIPESSCVHHIAFCFCFHLLANSNCSLHTWHVVHGDIRHSRFTSHVWLSSTLSFEGWAEVSSMHSAAQQFGRFSSTEHASGRNMMRAEALLG